MKLVEKLQALLQPSAMISGRDISDSLIAIAQEVARMRGFKQEELPYYLIIYRDLRVEVLRRNGANAAEVERFSAKCDALYTCMEELGYRNIDLLCCEICHLFAEKSMAGAAH